MSIYVFALLIGVIAGLRALTAPAAVSWAAWLGWLPVQDGWAAFMGYRYTPYVFTLLAVVEVITDQFPSTPARTVPQQFSARIFSGALCGAVIGAAGGPWIGGLIAGVVGAVIGTLGGYQARTRLVAATGGKDTPIAILEDAIAIVGAYLIVRYAV
ncbi:DUF4126 family protein [Mesorhizobium sp. KR1-2]|uniref:DUF4126 family protein n=1 Tax=Mesorhizobium sp. KR1-2 TaxID=3156609 RepID=UPI0032B3A694